MRRVRNPDLLCCAPLLLPLFLLGCSNDEAPPPESPQEVAAKKRAATKEEAAKAEAAKPTLEPPPKMSAPKPPPSLSLREGAPVVVAQYTGGMVVPMATLRGTAWTVEEVFTLDKMPEGTRGKDAHSEVLVEWWNKLDIQAGDTFVLRGDRGAEGTFKVKREFAAADRGGCMGLVWAIPGDVEWKVKPKGKSDDLPEEHVWALRGAWTPGSGVLGRDLTEAERKAGREGLKRAREVIRSNLPALPKGSWQECDSLSDPPCKARGAQLLSLDLEGDGVAEAVGTIQIRPPGAAGNPSPGVSPVESRILLSLTDKGGLVLGRWDGEQGRQAEDAQAPAFSGLLDITGDGRSEIILSRTANETQNWEVFQASPDKPGTWISLFKTQFEGC